ncbi:MAG TPA: extracellular solute-binding protein [Kofleriaceae bacterium]|nr:extracellular solute-binding protein [Kofleriaceae bacterium]
MIARKQGFTVTMLAVALAMVGAAAGCSKGGGTSASQGSDKGVSAEKTMAREPEAKPAPEPKEKIKLTVNDFGVFGYKPLYAEYQQSHPNIEIIESVNEYNTHHSNLINHLAAGSGAADIEAVDEGFMAQLKARPEQFVNLLDFGAGELEKNYPAFKWQASLSADGKKQIGLGTDVGGLAMCYRTDLFAKAKLPTDPAEVSALWPTWDKYVETGIKFKAANTGATFFDAATNLYNGQVFQLDKSYYEPGTNQVIAGTNPGVKAAWDLTMKAIAQGLSAKLVAWQPDWVTAFQKGSFATITCPAWMQGYIKENAPGTAGKWNIAAVPGAAGNWGGSWLTIPAQGKHPKEAYELAVFLTAPAQQVRVFKDVGNFPSAIPAMHDPSVENFKNPFFNDAPTGKIFSQSAVNLKPQYQGEKHGPIRKAMEDGITRVEQGRQKPDAAFAQAIKDAARAAR